MNFHNPTLLLSSRKKAFTLIELLVVIAIIAILASILFPVFGRARENARRSSCMSNMKQIGLGVLQYTQDYDEYFPSTNFNYTATGPNGGTYAATWDTVIQPYIKSGQILQCPSDSQSQRVSGHPLYGDNAYRSYSAAQNLCGDFGSGNPPKNIAVVQAASLTVFAAHRVNGGSTAISVAHWNYYCDIGSLGSQVPFLHLDTAPFLYADGHVKSIHGVTGVSYPTFPGYAVDATGSANSLPGAQLPS